MKKNIIKIVVLILILVGVYYVCVFFNIGPVGYQWSICENGYYSKYPKGILDGGSEVYNSDNKLVGSCMSWFGCYETGTFDPKNSSVGQTEFGKKIGKCSQVSFSKILITKKLGF